MSEGLDEKQRLREEAELEATGDENPDDAAAAAVIGVART